jgi:2-haloacid dehalogenase
MVRAPVGRPVVVAFDVIETMFSLDAVGQRLAAVGAAPDRLGEWFARLLRDGFALSASGSYQPFGTVAGEALRAVLPGCPTDAEVRAVLEGFLELDAHPDVEPAMRRLRQRGVRIVTVSNGSAQVTSSLLERAGLDSFVEQVLSVDDVRVWKPAAAPYLHVATSTGVAPASVALVAVHAWDMHGAGRAGLVTGWASRHEGRFAATFDPPDVTGRDLVEVADGLLALPER